MDPSWLAIAPAAAGDRHRGGGGVRVLVGLLTQLRSYEARLASAAPATQGEESSIN